MKRVTMVVNGAKADAEAAAALHERVAAAFAEAGWPKPELVLTTEQDHGSGLARTAAENGAAMVVACGGDGTVNAVAQGLADTGVVLGVLPLGTGNLLAGHLCVPTALDDAIKVLTQGADRRFDLGVMDDRIFVGMAGLGLDAAMIADASEKLKAKVGWAAYVPSILRHLRDRGERVSLRLDGHRVHHRRVKALLVGNFGTLHGGIDLMPEAAPDDGVLDVVILEPDGGIMAWLGVLARLLLRRDDPRVSRYQARGLEVRTRRPVPFELDGDVCHTANAFSIQVKHCALLVRAPAPDPEKQPSDTAGASARSTAAEGAALR